MVASASHTMFNHPTQEDLRRLLPLLSRRHRDCGCWTGLSRGAKPSDFFGRILAFVGFFFDGGDEALLFIVAHTKAGTTPCAWGWHFVTVQGR